MDKFFKTGESVANQSMEMEVNLTAKNGQNLKIQVSKANILVMSCFVLFSLIFCYSCDKDDDYDNIRSLQNFKGEFVENESEAKVMIKSADDKIQAAIQLAITDDSKSGRYNKNGISVDYSVTSIGNYGSKHITQKATINGNFDGYEVQGYYNLIIDWTYSSLTEYQFERMYDCWYSISNGTKGMKVITTGKMTSKNWKEFTWNLNHAAYDNSNKLRYEFKIN